MFIRLDPDGLAYCCLYKIVKEKELVGPTTVVWLLNVTLWQDPCSLLQGGLKWEGPLSILNIHKVFKIERGKMIIFVIYLVLLVAQYYIKSKLFESKSKLNVGIVNEQMGLSQRKPSQPSVHTQVFGWAPQSPWIHPGRAWQTSQFSPIQPSKQLLKFKYMYTRHAAPLLVLCNPIRNFQYA